MSKIVLAGKPLYTLKVAEIIELASRREHQIFVGGPHMDFYRNRDLLKLFEGVEELDNAAALMSYMHVSPHDYSERFNALRCGELLNWARQKGLAVQHMGRWKLINREQIFELCGPARKQVAVQVRGTFASSEDAYVGAKAWEREVKRRERARVRQVTQLFERVKKWVPVIVEHTPDAVLEGPLERFTVPGICTIGECNQLLLERFSDMEVQEAQRASFALAELFADADRKRQDLEAMLRQAAIDLEGLEL